MGAYWRKLGKIATPQISLKFGESVVIRFTKHRLKYFDRAVSRLTSRGQIDIHVACAPIKEISKNRIGDRIDQPKNMPAWLISMRWLKKIIISKRAVQPSLSKSILKMFKNFGGHLWSAQKHAYLIDIDALIPKNHNIFEGRPAVIE